MKSIPIDQLPLSTKDKSLVRSELKSSEIQIPQTIDEYLNNNSILWNFVINPTLISEKLIDPPTFKDKYIKVNYRFRYLAFATFDNSYFTLSSMYKTILRFIRSRNASFKESDLTEVDMKFSKHANTSFVKSRLYKADLRGSKFIRCDFRSCNLQECDIRDAIFQNCKFDNSTNLHGVMVNDETDIPSECSLYPLKFENTQHVTIRERDILVHTDPQSKEKTVWQRKPVRSITDYPFKKTWIGNTEHYGQVSDDMAKSVLMIIGNK